MRTNLGRIVGASALAMLWCNNASPFRPFDGTGAAVTREQHADLFLSTILEGPHDWPVRPVAEIAYERDFGRVETKSALVGAIWQVRDDLAVDIGLRGGRINNRPLAEIRAGLTFS